MERIEKEEGIRFEDLFEDGFTRVTLIVMFLALLELIRLGLVKIYQEKAFGVIWVINPQIQADTYPAGVVQELLS
jgi:segregation and condensation protein A